MWTFTALKQGCCPFSGITRSLSVKILSTVYNLRLTRLQEKVPKVVNDYFRTMWVELGDQLTILTNLFSMSGSTISCSSLLIWWLSMPFQGTQEVIWLSWLLGWSSFKDICRGKAAPQGSCPRAIPQACKPSI